MVAFVIIVALAMGVVLFFTGCGTPITFSGSYITQTGETYGGSVGISLPEKKGLSK